MSLNEIKKEIQIAGKGDNAMLEIVDRMEHTPSVAAAVKNHVPGNGRTCVHIFTLALTFGQ
jgi:hypothetical protein